MPDDRTGDVFVFTRAAVREVDRLAVEQYAIPPIVLMENAARHIADVALDGLEDDESPSVLIICGPGNNGGDGFAAARHLHNAGLAVEVLLASGDRYQGESAVNLDIIRRMGLRISPADPVSIAHRAAERRPSLFIDALFGTGLARPVSGDLAGIIDAVNTLAAAAVPVLAVDCPSGMDVDSGEPLGAAIKATITVTLVGLKEGFLNLPAQALLGEVVVADIGAPRELVERLGRRIAPAAACEPRAADRATEMHPPASKGRRMREP